MTSFGRTTKMPPVRFPDELERTGAKEGWRRR
ncbi:hypothetical protein NK6_3266 [Bradyrhizobium diazoefficiens]|uniref:Uncharacterized protein n=1 Tax=Bradyrhizobium diazoefficiens TaxID=1355477 RepID=A0A0E4BP45_9BRAD|nr:hypothetical protein NK6_3266 [Bradyrhizobium diazoefficiens]